MSCTIQACEKNYTKHWPKYSTCNKENITKRKHFLCPYQINSEQDIPLFVTQALGADSCTYKWQKLNKYHPRLRTTVSYQFLSGAGQDVVGEWVGVLQSVPTLGYR